ncbi:MAG: hypothetical protein Q8861_12555 [Bacteroidota bacterium]|nr:hypothetical protein [Bacteroidota bacterium]
MKRNTIIFGIIAFILTSCNISGGNKKLTQRTQLPTSKELHIDKLFIVGNFNGDNTLDTIKESYINSLTGKEIVKPDITDFALEKIVKTNALSRLYSNISGVDTFIVTRISQQRGLYYLKNLGDINGDKKDEFGYIIDWADESNLNSIHVMTLNNGRIVELFCFKIHEQLSFDPENLIDQKFIVKPISKKEIEYKFYSDSATFEIGKHKFE